MKKVESEEADGSVALMKRNPPFPPLLLSSGVLHEHCVAVQFAMVNELPSVSQNESAPPLREEREEHDVMVVSFRTREKRREVEDDDQEIRKAGNEDDESAVILRKEEDVMVRIGGADVDVLPDSSVKKGFDVVMCPTAKSVRDTELIDEEMAKGGKDESKSR